MQTFFGRIPWLDCVKGSTMELNANLPFGPIEQKWDLKRFEMKLVSFANKHKHSIIVVGSGLTGASAAASLAEQGYYVQCFCYQSV